MIVFYDRRKSRESLLNMLLVEGDQEMYNYGCCDLSSFFTFIQILKGHRTWDDFQGNLERSEGIMDVEVRSLDEESEDKIGLRGRTSRMSFISADKANLDPVVQDWLSQGSDFSVKDLRKYWAKEVPLLFSPERDCDCLNITYDEEAVKRILFQTLDSFISGSLDTEPWFESLKELDGPPKLCGRLFKNGEPTYSCKDCGFDPTCVLCVDCFKASSHRNHKYRMSMSGGGGYCDCGDSEAWKKDAFCSIHLRGLQEETASGRDKLQPEDKLPQGVPERVKTVMKAALRYSYELLTWTTSVRLPEDLELTPEEVRRTSVGSTTSSENSLVVGSPTTTEDAEMFATMLFNDEIHTYEQVISTLSRAIECTQKEAIDFATTIDREGRSIVKCSNFQICQQVKMTIERITSRHGSKPLRVEVMLVSLIAHQTFSMRLLSWLQQLLSYCEAFRRLFSGIIMECYDSSSRNLSLLEQIMTSDVRLWKTARNQWHQLFITGLLMESESKKNFAKVFTRIYSSLMKEFVRDDHEHSVSITSLSVQLYTVPSLGHTLIAEDDALLIMVRSFLDECSKYRNHDGKLQFERNHIQIMNFRRSQYILIDLRYLLSAKPNNWTDSMRTNFLHAFIKLVDLLDWMQGMDAVVRQVGQHVEFEAEWETGINLQLKLAHVISLIIEWAGSDRIVLNKCLRHAMKELYEKQGKMTMTPRSMLGLTVNDCVDYEVATLPVSVHLPLSRMVSGLLLHLTRYDVNYHSHELHMNVPKKPSLIELMELPLRTLVMISQFRAGMWRRNGYSLVNQVYFYHNVRLREEMYDRDILMLQYVAAFTDANDFLIHVINKFGLFLVWSQENYESHNRKPEEDYLRQTITLIEEFLSLILIIVSERFTPGVGDVTNDDRIKKEIIQWLCVEPMAHSDLLKVLPKDTSSDGVVESLINEVAVFKRPGVNAAGGKYEVRPQLLQDFNPFFYHYTRQDQSTAEEVQLKRKKVTGEAFICCPPPSPPQLSMQFQDLKHLLDCDVMIHVVSIVLARTLNAYSTSFSETQFEKMLHLIGVALHEEERTIRLLMEDPSLADQPKFDFAFTRRCSKKGIPSQLEECLKSPKIQGHRELLRWVIDKFNTVSGKRGYSPTAGSSLDSSMVASSQFMFEKKKNAEEAAKRRSRIMAQMQSQQQNFLKENAHFFVNLPTEESSSVMDVRESEVNSEPVAVGLKQKGKVISSEEHTCILCREEQEVSSSGRCLVLAAFVQRSTVLSKNRERKVNFTDEAVEAVFMPADLYFGPHVSTCGHVMHSDCWQKYFESVLAKERRRPVRHGRHVSFDVDKSEFLCPLCECLSNAVIPVLPNLDMPVVNNSMDISMSDWLNALHAAVEGSQPIWVKDPSMNIETGEKYICRLKPAPLIGFEGKVPDEVRTVFVSLSKQYEDTAEKVAKLSPAILEMMRLLSQAVYTIGLNVHQNTEDDRVAVISYWSCAFTIHSIERVLRDEGKTIFSDLSSRKFNCLQALVRYIAVSSGVFNVAVIRTHAIKLLKYLLVSEAHSTSPTSCLDIDAFGLLVSLVMSSPSMYVQEEKDDPGCILTPPTGNVFDRNYLNLVITLQLVQIILTKEAPVVKSMAESSCDEPMDAE